MTPTRSVALCPLFLLTPSASADLMRFTANGDVFQLYAPDSPFFPDLQVGDPWTVEIDFDTGALGTVVSTDGTVRYNAPYRFEIGFGSETRTWITDDFAPDELAHFNMHVTNDADRPGQTPFDQITFQLSYVEDGLVFHYVLALFDSTAQAIDSDDLSIFENGIDFGRFGLMSGYAWFGDELSGPSFDGPVDSVAVVAIPAPPALVPLATLGLLKSRRR